jgi:hypothetical protein
MKKTLLILLLVVACLLVSSRSVSAGGCIQSYGDGGSLANPAYRPTYVYYQRCVPRYYAARYRPCPVGQAAGFGFAVNLQIRAPVYSAPPACLPPSRPVETHCVERPIVNTIENTDVTVHVRHHVDQYVDVYDKPTYKTEGQKAVSPAPVQRDFKNVVDDKKVVAPQRKKSKPAPAPKPSPTPVEAES